MVTNEKIIKFPVPNWNRVISSDLDSMAYCVCYRYDFSSSGFGPYGFNTERSLKIINNSFHELFFYKKDSSNENAKLTNAVSIKEEGIYLYGDNQKIKSLGAEIDKYYIAKKKNEIKKKKSLISEPLPPKPLLLNLSNNQLYESNIIKKIIATGCGLFISHHYMPEAGSTIILFDQYILSSLKNNASFYGVDFLEVASIDELKAW